MAASQHPEATVIEFPRALDEPAPELGDRPEQPTVEELARAYATLAARYQAERPLIVDWMRAISAQQTVLARRLGSIEDRLTAIEAAQADTHRAIAEVLKELRAKP